MHSFTFEQTLILIHVAALVPAVIVVTVAAAFRFVSSWKDRQ